MRPHETVYESRNYLIPMQSGFAKVLAFFHTELPGSLHCDMLARGIVRLQTACSVTNPLVLGVPTHQHWQDICADGCPP